MERRLSRRAAIGFPGDCGWHNFSDLVPTTEIAVGNTVYVVGRGEYVMHPRIGSAAAETVPEVWNCSPPDVSSLTSLSGRS